MKLFFIIHSNIGVTISFSSMEEMTAEGSGDLSLPVSLVPLAAPIALATVLTVCIVVEDTKSGNNLIN